MNSTNSPVSSAGNVSYPRLVTLIGRVWDVIFLNKYLFCMLHYSEQYYMHWWFLTLSLMYI